MRKRTSSRAQRSALEPSLMNSILITPFAVSKELIAKSKTIDISHDPRPHLQLLIEARDLKDEENGNRRFDQEPVR
jgi:hypothetical protein